MNIRCMGVAAVVFAATHAPLAAQVRADPGTVINGRVAVRVYVTLSDNEVAYAPIGGVNLRFFRTTADTVIAVQTDDAGTATALLLPGEYRLMSTSPVDWKGARYSWNQIVQVRAGLPTIELRASTAVREVVAADSVAAPSPAARRARDERDLLKDEKVIVQKDPSMATMYSFFAPGTGHMYADERGKGAGLLALSVTGVVLAARSLSCAADSQCESTTGGMTLGAAGMLAFFGSWIYGVMDSGAAARRYNNRYGLAASRVQPIIVPGMDGGRVGVGISVALPRGDMSLTLGGR
jgi:hypothetical protein